MRTDILLGVLQEVEKRAERVNEQDVIDTYVDDHALVGALSSRDNGIIFGRRGTGKTHALKYLAEKERGKGNRVIYIDVEKDLGSTQGRYSDKDLPLSERATRLIVDLLGLVHNLLLENAFAEDSGVQIDLLDRMMDHFSEVYVSGEVETESTTSQEHSEGTSANFGGKISLAGAGIHSGSDSSSNMHLQRSDRVSAAGRILRRVHFGEVSRSMRQVIETDRAERFWILLDEWSGISTDLQPYVAEMLRKLFFGIGKVTVRIGAIPHRSEWRVSDSRGSYVGVEIGSEIFPLLDLDEFVVFPARSREQQKQRSLSFFRTLLFRHISKALADTGRGHLESPEELVSSLFTQVTSLQEIVRAAEGVPRDAISIVGWAGMRTGGSKIAVNHVRGAAGQLYTKSKAVQLNGIPAARDLLDRIIADVISGRKARAFLLPQAQTADPLIQQLVDDRILHIIKRGYSGKDSPGERFDVLQIDYGCYVHLLGTSASPQSFLSEESGDEAAFAAIVGEVDVPEDDYRAIRRAVLDLTAFS